MARDEIIGLADRAMYEIKTRGKDDVVHYVWRGGQPAKVAPGE